MKLAKITLCLILMLQGVASYAATISWGSYAGSALYDSNGALLGDSFVFELGSFGSFVPTELNMADWAANWKVFDRAWQDVGEPAGTDGWNSAGGYFTSTATLESDNTSDQVFLTQHVFGVDGGGAPVAEQAFIWAFNTQTYSPSAEWALITNTSSDGVSADNWTFPATTDSHGPLVLDWRIDEATSIIFGGANNTEGPGGYTFNPGSFDFQTHSAAAPVPEPSSAFAVMLAGLLTRCMRRRQRRH